MIIKKLTRFGLASLTVGAMSVYSLPAYAQIDEIIVTARKTQESLQDVPISITAVTGDFLRDSGAVEFTDVAAITPNFNIQEDDVIGGLFASITIRGQSSANQSLNTDPAVGIIVNGAPVTRGTNIMSNLFDVEQIEVLKGPQGTLFGKNTTGGNLIIRTVAPKLGEFEAFVEAELGNFDRRNFSGVFNVPVGDNLAFRFGAASQKQDGYTFGVSRVDPGLPADETRFPFVDLRPLGVSFGPNGEYDDFTSEPTGSEFNDDDEIFYRASALYEPDDKLSIRLNADFHKVEESGPGAVVLNEGIVDVDLLLGPTGAPPGVGVPERTIAVLGGLLGFPVGGPGDPVDAAGFPVVPGQLGAGSSFFGVAIPTLNDDFYAVSDQRPFAPRLEADEYNLNATIKYDFGPVLLESITSYRNQEGESDLPAAASADVFLAQESDIFAQEVRLSGNLDDRLKWQGGVFYAKEEGSDKRDVAGDNFSFGAENETKAIFGQGTYAVTDRFNLTAGLRYTEEDRGIEQLTQAVEGPIPQQTVSFNGTSWNVAADYKVTEDVLTYASISRGFKSGGIGVGQIDGVVDPDSGITLEEITIDPEFVTNYEVGLKGDFLDNRVRWNTSGFYSDYTDIQQQGFSPTLIDAGGNAVVVTVNAGEAEIYGFESELTFAPNDNLTFGGALGYTKAEFTEFNDVDIVTEVVDDRSDEEIGGPEWSFSAFARYDHEISNDLDAGMQLNLTHRGSQELLAGGEVDLFADPSQAVLKSNTLVNGQIDFDFKKLDTNVAFYGRNLLDEKYNSGGFALTAFGQPLAQRFRGAPREYGVRVRKNF